MNEPINEVKWRNELRAERPEFEITIKENGKTIYQNTAFAGCLNVVEKVDEFNVEELSFWGATQSLAFGHPAIITFSFDQLRVKIGHVLHEAVVTLMKYSHDPGLKKAMENIAKANNKK